MCTSKPETLLQYKAASRRLLEAPTSRDESNVTTSPTSKIYIHNHSKIKKPWQPFENIMRLGTDKRNSTWGQTNLHVPIIRLLYKRGGIKRNHTLGNPAINFGFKST